MAAEFLARMGVDWGPAITGTRDFLARIEAEVQGLNKLGPGPRNRALAQGAVNIGEHIQGLVQSEIMDPRQGARLKAQALGKLDAYQNASNEALVEETVARRREAQLIRQAASQRLQGDEAYQATQTEVTVAKRLEAQQTRQRALRELESNEAYLAARAESIASQRRIDAETRARAKELAPGTAGAGGGGGTSLLGQVGQGALLGAGFKVAMEVRQAVEEALKLNQQLRILQEQADAIGQSSGFPALRQQVIDISRETGVAGSKVASLAAEFLGLYQSTGQAAVATSDAAKLLRVIGGEATTAGPQIAALAEDLGVSVQDIGNAVIDLQDKTGRTGTDMLAALGQVAPVAAELNLTLDQTRALIEAVGIGSAKTGQQLGEGLARVLPELQKNLPKIEQLGIKVSPDAAAGNTVQALKDLLAGYGQLSQAQQQLVVSQLGGPRNAATLAAAFRDPARALAELDSKLQDHDLLNRRAAAAEDNLQGSLDKLHQALVALGDSFARSGVIDGFSEFLHLLTQVLSLLDGAPAKLAAVAIGLKVLSSITIGGGGGGLGTLAGLTGGLLARPAGAHYAGGAAGAATAEGAGGGAAAGINPVLLVSALALTYAISTEREAKTRLSQKRSDLLKELDKQSDEELRNRLSDKGEIDHADTSGGAGVSPGVWLAQHIWDRPGPKNSQNRDVVKMALTQHLAARMSEEVTTLLSANVFTGEDLSRVTEDLKTPTDAKAVGDLRNRVIAAETTPQGQAALRNAQLEKERVDALKRIRNGAGVEVQSLQDAKGLYAEGEITWDEYLSYARQEIDTLAKYQDPTQQTLRNKEIVDLAKERAKHLKDLTQTQLQDLQAVGGLSTAREIAIYRAEAANPDADPALKADAHKAIAAAQAKELQALISADANLAKARANGDPVGVAEAAQDQAQNQLDVLRQNGFGKDSAEYRDALAKKLEADQAVVDAQRQIGVANIELLKAQDAADPVKVARDNQRAAAEALAGAHGEAERIRAEASKVTADQSYNDAINSIARAKLELLKAVRTAGGDTVGAAQVTVQEARQAIQQAEDRRVPTDSAEMIGLQRSLVEAQAGEVSARIQQIETSVDQDLALRSITVRQAVARLRDAQQIATSDTERKTIEVKIRQLLDQTGRDLAFNIPQGVQVPTLYQVRRFEATRGVGGGYNDNRNIDVKMFITNGMDESKAKQFVGDLFGTSSSVVGSTSRSY